MSKKLSTERLGRIRDLSNHGFANLNSQEDLLSHIAAQDAEIAELKKEVRDWRNASLTNNSTIGDRQKVIECLREQLEKAKGALNKMENEFVQKHDGPVVTRHYYARDVLAELEVKF